MGSNDAAGRVVTSTDAAGNITLTDYSFDANGNPVTTTTYPDEAISIETRAKDGSTLSVAGTGAHPVRYEYGVDANGSFAKVIRLGDGGAETEWTTGYTDALGRGYLTVQSGGAETRSFYNTLGQLVKTIDADGRTMLYLYNVKGEQEFSAIDMNGNGQIDYAGTDRVTRTASEVTTAHGMDVRRSSTYVWDQAGVDSSTLVSVSEAAVTGLESWSTSFGRTSHSQTVYNGTGGKTVTDTAPDGSYTVTVYQDGRLVSATRFDADDTQLAQTTYAYDAHGRQATITDARTGATTFAYNDADQLLTVTTPDPDGAGPQTSQVTAYQYDTRGRTSQVTMPDSGVVHYTYWPTGELRRTWGARTYPVEYAYDTQGRRTTMTTWKDFAGDSGQAVTTWSYDPVRGFLTSKLYDDGKGPSYTYTPAGRLLTRTWSRLVVPPLGGPDSPLVTTYGYNTAGDQVSIDYSDATPDVTFSYDRLGRRTGVVDAAGTQTLTYTPDSQPDTTTYAAGPLDGVSLSSAYDALGRRSNVTWSASVPASNGATGYTYDAASRLETVTAGSTTVTYAYLPNSDLVGTVTHSTGGTDKMTTTKTHDNLNRLVSISQTAAGQTVSSHTYVYNAANQGLRSTLADGSYWLYEYDSLGQVVAGTKHLADGAPISGMAFGYAFNDIGNRRFVVPPSGGQASYTSNALNQYESRQVPGVVDVRGDAEPQATVTLNVGGAVPAATLPTTRHDRYYHGALPVDNTAAPVWADLSIVGVKNNAGPNGEDAVTTQTGHAFVPKTPEPFTLPATGVTPTVLGTDTIDMLVALGAVGLARASLIPGAPRRSTGVRAEPRRLAGAVMWIPNVSWSDRCRCRVTPRVGRRARRGRVSWCRGSVRTPQHRRR